MGYAPYRLAYRGRRFPMFKRGDLSASDPWIVYVEYKTKRHKLTTRRGDKGGAEVQAKLIIDSILDNKPEALAALMFRAPKAAPAQAPEAKQVTCTVGQICDAYETAKDLDVGKLSRTKALRSFRLSIRRALGLPVATYTTRDVEAAAMDAETDALSMDIFTAKFARDYWSKMREVINTYDGDQTLEARARVTWNSQIRAARSLLIPRLQFKYQDMGLRLPPTLPEFFNALKADSPKRVQSHYTPPPQALIRKTLHDWLKIQNRDLFLAIGLHLCFGLRQGETRQIQWGDFNTDHGAPFLHCRHVQVKSQSGDIQVPPIDPFWTCFVHRIHREGWKGQPGETVLHAQSPGEVQTLYRELSAWMLHLGWNTPKKSHALRAYAGSLVAMRFDIYRASKFLRHASVAVTEIHYTQFLGPRVFRPGRVLVRWGRIAL